MQMVTTSTFGEEVFLKILQKFGKKTSPVRGIVQTIIDHGTCNAFQIAPATTSEKVSECIGRGK